MTKPGQHLVFLIASVLLSNPLTAQTDTIPGTPNERPVEASYANSVFFAGGGGTPIGMRLEAGYNIEDVVKLGVTFGAFDSWSNNPRKGTLGWLGGLYFSGILPKIHPYVLIGRGATFSLFGDSDHFTHGYFGMMILLTRLVTLRPELVLAYTSRHISGGKGLFEDFPEVAEKKLLVGIAVMLEIELKNL